MRNRAHGFPLTPLCLVEAAEEATTGSSVYVCRAYVRGPNESHGMYVLLIRYVPAAIDLLRVSVYRGVF
eukprot:6182786-Pleurochrysis_carterae.AAC.6